MNLRDAACDLGSPNTQVLPPFWRLPALHGRTAPLRATRTSTAAPTAPTKAKVRALLAANIMWWRAWDYNNISGVHVCVPLSYRLCTPLRLGAAAAVDLCPEWTRSEVLAYVAIYLRVAGFCALGSGLYVAAGACRLRPPPAPALARAPAHAPLFFGEPIGIVSARKLARNLRDYRCEYV